MTFALFILVFGAFLLIILNLLPVATALPSEFASSFSTLVSTMKAWDSIFPISELLTVVSLVVTFHIAVLLFKLFRWVIHLIRGNNA